MKIADVHGEITQVEALVPVARTANFNGSTVDITQFQGIVKVILHSAAGAGTTPTMTCKVQTGDQANGSDAVDIDGATFAQVTSASASLQAIGVNTRSCKRFIRVVGTIGGISPSFLCSSVIVGQTQVI